MTAGDMNARRRIFRATTLTAALAMPAMLGGCVTALDYAESPDPSETARIAEIVRANAVYPRWEDFPTPLEDGPSADEAEAAVAQVRTIGVAQEAEAAALDWSIDDPGAFSAAITARVREVPVSADARRTQAEIEAFAARLRERGRAPPPIPRR